MTGWVYWKMNLWIKFDLTYLIRPYNADGPHTYLDGKVTTIHALLSDSETELLWLSTVDISLVAWLEHGMSSLEENLKSRPILVDLVLSDNWQHIETTVHDLEKKSIFRVF